MLIDIDKWEKKISSNYSADHGYQAIYCEDAVKADLIALVIEITLKLKEESK